MRRLGWIPHCQIAANNWVHDQFKMGVAEEKSESRWNHVAGKREKTDGIIETIRTCDTGQGERTNLNATVDGRGGARDDAEDGKVARDLAHLKIKLSQPQF